MRLALLSVLALAACQSPGAPRLETPADSLAYRVTEAAGGLAAWESLPGLRWEWAVAQDSTERIRTRHVWDRRGDRARVEWPAGEDSFLVAVYQPSRFDPAAPAGQVALNGAPLSTGDASARLVEAHERFVNDGYWLLAPFKVLDAGVRREIDRETGVDRLALSFDGVGLTPGDRYWVDVEPVTGAFMGWSYRLESGNEGEWRWVEPVQVQTPGGPITLSRAKLSGDGRTIILTEPEALQEIDEAEFTDLRPRLGPAL